MADYYSPSVVREIVDGQLRDKNKFLDPHTGRVDPELAKVLSFRARAWENSNKTDRPYEESGKWADAVRSSDTRRTTDAVQFGNQSQIAFETGLVEQRFDSSKVPELSRLYGLFRQHGTVLNFCGGTNNGKTNVLYLGIDVKTDIDPSTLVIGNCRPSDLDHDWPEYRYIETIDELEYELDNEPEREKVVFIDDASIDHSAHSSSSKEVAERQGRLVRLAAKRHSVIAYVGHREDGIDLAKHIRAMPGVRHLLANRIDNEDGTTDRYIASVYDSQDSDTGRLSDLAFTLDPLPKARSSYDPDATAANLFY